MFALWSVEDTTKQQSVKEAGADPADRFFFWGGKSWRRVSNLLPFSSFSTDLGHFILKLRNFDIYFLFYVRFLSLFSRFGGQTGHFRPWGVMAPCPLPPWIRICKEGTMF